MPIAGILCGWVNGTELRYISQGNNWENTANVFSNSKNVCDNNWRHVAITDDNGKVKIYVDGALDKTYSYSRNPAKFSQLIRAGFGAFIRGVGVNGFFNGTIDEVMIYNRTLAAEEIKSLSGFG